MTNWPTHAVVLPGTGSDAQFAADAFGPALTRARIAVHAVQPDPTAVIAGYDAALNAASHEHGPIVVGGISIGAAAALTWALRHPEQVCGILAALPPWIGDAADAPAALSARLTAESLLADGLESVTAAMTATTPTWLSTTLTRSWASQWPNLPAALSEAASYRAPDLADLRRLRVPTAIVAASDDPVHPMTVARTWHAEIGRSSLSTVSLDDIATDAGILGERSVAALTLLLG